MTAITRQCPECQGSGRHYWSRYGGNDPDVVDRGPCEKCDGEGEIIVSCDDCREPAVERIDGHPYCATHAAEVRADQQFEATTGM